MKQRIIGLIILIGIALIFLPILFTRLESAESVSLHAGDSIPNSLPPTTTSLAVHHQSVRQPATTMQTAQNQVIYQQAPTQTVSAPSATVAAQASETPANVPASASPAATPLPVAPEPPTMLTMPVTTTAAAPPVQAVEQPAPSAPAPAEAAAESAHSLPESPAPAAITNPPDNNPHLNNSSALPSNETENSQPNNNEAPPQTSDTNPPTTAPVQPPADVQPIPTAPSPHNVSNTMAASEASILHLAPPSAHRKTATHAPRKTIAAKPKTHVDKLTTTAKNRAISSPAVNDHGWIVQIGSFAQENHVEKLVQQLHAHGFVAQVMPLHTSHGTMTRVYLGPEKQRAQADYIAKQLREQLTIQSIVVSIK